MNKHQQRVCIVIGTLELGGAERHLAQVLPELHRRGWEISVLVMKQSNALTDQLRADGVQVLEAPSLVRLSGQFLLLKQCIRLGILLPWLLWNIWKNRGALLHFFLPETYVLGAMCALLTCRRRPMLMSRRSLNYYQQKRPHLIPIEHWLHRRMDVILGNSQAVIDQLRDEEKIEVGKLKLIYNGVDLIPFEKTRHRGKHSDRQKQGKPELVLIMVANLISYKGHTDLLAALAGIMDRLPADWRLDCVGADTGILPELKKQTLDFGLQQHVRWLGICHNIPELLSAADIGILCSHQEGFSNAVLEYMAAGLPVIATDVGGNSEAVFDGQSGWLVPPRDLAQLGEKILDLVGSDEKRHAFGAEGRARMEHRFSLESCVDSYAELYQSLQHD